MGQARGKIAGKFSEEYLNNVAVCELNPDDLKSLGIVAGQNVRLSTKSGSVVLRAVVAAQPVQRGVAFIPYGPWVNSVFPSDTHATGMPSLKGVEAQITTAVDEKVLDLRSLIEGMVKKK